MKFEAIVKNESRLIQQSIISNIKELIIYKNLEPGDKLPSERMLSEKFAVSRSALRETIQKLEFFGLLKSKPQSGTFIADIGQIAMNGMLDDILGLEKPDFKSLVETRIPLEFTTVKLAAKRRTKTHLKRIKKALEAYKKKILAGSDYLQEDLLFHLEIAKASKNSTLNTLMLLITPEIIGSYEQSTVCEGDQALTEIKKHEDIFLAIEQQNSALAEKKMKIHFTKLYEYLKKA